MKSFLILLAILVSTAALGDGITKLNNTQIQVTQTTKNVVDVRMLKLQYANLQRQIANANTQLQKLADQISQAKAVGVDPAIPSPTPSPR